MIARGARARHLRSGVFIMKRSMTVSLVLAGSAALGLSGCKPKAESFASVAACEDSGRHTHEECVDAFTAAKGEHEAKAQHFKTREECVAAFGPDACMERNEGGHSFFMPMMLGYMLGRSVGSHPVYAVPYQPSCVSGAGGTRFGACGGTGGSGGGSAGGWFRGGSSLSGAGGETSTVSRGGFGQAGHGFSGGGE
jgi:uncharacterized protein YgiB involved in biofilm formation